MRSPLARLNRIKYKLTASLVLTVAVTMSASWFVFDRLVSRALAIALNDDVENGLTLGLQSRRDLFDAKKRCFRAAAEGHGRDHRLVRALGTGDAASVAGVLEKMLEEQPEALSFTVVAEAPTGPVHVGRPEDMYPEDRWRRFEVQVEVDGTAARIEEIYAVPWSLFDEFEEAGRVLETFQTFQRNTDDFRLGFVWFYLITVGAVSFLVGTAVFLYSLRFGRRIGLLGRATEQVGRGDLEVTVQDPVGDELTDLASAFNRMVSEIRQGRERIEYLQRVSAWQEFARRLAHEIKNPLTPIQLAIQEIRSTYKGDDPRFKAVIEESYEIVEEEIAVLRRLTGEFSSFARLPRVTPRPMDLGEFISDVTPSLTSYARSKGIELEVQTAGAPVVVDIDATMLRRVVDNLVHNAVEAIERKAGRDQRVSVRTATDGPGVVHIRVSDTGPGIAPEHVSDVFAPYYTTRSEGTGLGLAITKKIVLEHGGSIRVEESTPDGTTFLIELPTR